MKVFPPALAAAGLFAIAYDALAEEGNRGKWRDQGNGTYINPILPGGFSDPDVIASGAPSISSSPLFNIRPAWRSSTPKT